MSYSILKPIIKMSEQKALYVLITHPSCSAKLSDIQLVLIPGLVWNVDAMCSPDIFNDDLETSLKKQN